ncbi:M24 family metallopeptidase [Bacterioplanoides sp.]|uniref:M24 family metallopeptidase n=1 Tax=Bacterioplanoides sp. TaxID=2066072 RepID=UPI003B5C3D12
MDRRKFLAGTVTAGLGSLAFSNSVLSQEDIATKRKNKFRLDMDAATADGEFPFEKAEYLQRTEKTRQLMRKQGINTLYVTSPEGMCYYTGYTATWYRGQSSSKWPALAVVVIHVDHDEPLHYDTEYEDYVHKATSVFDTQVWIPDEFMETGGGAQGGIEFILKDLKQRGWLKGRVGMELLSHVPNPVVSQQIRGGIEASGAEVVDSSLLIRGVRRVKSAREILYTEQAAKIADIGFAAIRDHFYPGVTPLELHGVAIQAMLAAGGELPGLNQGVISGPLAAAHAYSSRRPIEKGESFAVDLSGVVNRYHANICRSFVAGDPSEETLKMSQSSGNGIRLLCEHAKAGRKVSEVAKLIKQSYEEAGVWGDKHFVGGYELGLAFPPDWVGEWLFDLSAANSDDIFEENVVTNFESVFAGLDNGLIALLTLRPAIGVNIDTIIYGKEKSRSLSQLDFMPIVVG